MEELAGLLMQHMPAGVVSEMFSYLSASGPTPVPTDLPAFGINGYQDIRYTNQVVNPHVATRPQVTLKLVDHPGKFHDSKWLNLRAVPLLFAEELCSRVKIDLPSRSLNWINIFRH